MKVSEFFDNIGNHKTFEFKGYKFIHLKDELWRVEHGPLQDMKSSWELYQYPATVLFDDLEYDVVDSSVEKTTEPTQEMIDYLYQNGVSEDQSIEDFEPTSLIKGMAVELEHGNSFKLALEIAKDHLQEDPNYYDTELFENEASERLFGEEPINSNFTRDVLKMIEYFQKGSNPKSIAKSVKDIDKAKNCYAIAKSVGWEQAAEAFYNRLFELGLTSSEIKEIHIPEQFPGMGKFAKSEVTSESIPTQNLSEVSCPIVKRLGSSLVEDDSIVPIVNLGYVYYKDKDIGPCKLTWDLNEDDSITFHKTNLDTGSVLHEPAQKYKTFALGIHTVTDGADLYDSESDVISSAIDISGIESVTFTKEGDMNSAWVVYEYTNGITEDYYPYDSHKCVETAKGFMRKGYKCFLDGVETEEPEVFDSLEDSVMKVVK